MRNSLTTPAAFGALILLALLLTSHGCAVQDATPVVAVQRTFDSPDQAVSSLVDALRSGDQAQLREILGSTEVDLLSSGDEVADQNNVETFVTAYDEKHSIVPDGHDGMTLVIGAADWPMPIPIVKGAGNEPGKETWRFDTAAGMDEIINRRIGRNELDAIQTCLAIGDAQREYAIADPDRDGVPTYAQKILSDPGKKNGLYWRTKEGEEASPLGDLIAEASEQGYTSAKTSSGGASPYHGYHFRILHLQGPNATGGARDYIVNKQMVGGYAVIAWPADYRSSGVMTFIMSYEGTIYQRDLGEDTEKTVASMKAFDPDPEWTKVDADKPE
jgi:Protein of unknown function (DUF2950)